MTRWMRDVSVQMIDMAKVMEQCFSDFGSPHTVHQILYYMQYKSYTGVIRTTM